MSPRMHIRSAARPTRSRRYWVSELRRYDCFLTGIHSTWYAINAITYLVVGRQPTLRLGARIAPLPRNGHSADAARTLRS